MTETNGRTCPDCNGWIQDGVAHKCYDGYVYSEPAWKFMVEGEELLLIQVHCDNRVLHSPGYCSYCDDHGEEAQRQRLRLGVSFTNQPDRGKYPCPALTSRSEESINGWGGNQPHGPGVPQEDIDHFAEIERPSSHLMYGDTRARHAGSENPWGFPEEAIRPGDKTVPGGDVTWDEPWWKRIFRRK
jgi:hypothetical protein